MGTKRKGTRNKTRSNWIVAAAASVALVGAGTTAACVSEGGAFIMPQSGDEALVVAEYSFRTVLESVAAADEQGLIPDGARDDIARHIGNANQALEAAHTARDLADNLNAAGSTQRAIIALSAIIEILEGESE